MQKQVMNLHDFEKAVLHRMIFKFFYEGEISIQGNLPLNLETK
jgi:hypothetical protein